MRVGLGEGLSFGIMAIRLRSNSYAKNVDKGKEVMEEIRYHDESEKNVKESVVWYAYNYGNI